MKVSVRVSFRLESENHDSLQQAVADVTSRIKRFGDSWDAKGQAMDSIEVRGNEIKRFNVFGGGHGYIQPMPSEPQGKPQSKPTGTLS